MSKILLCAITLAFGASSAAQEVEELLSQSQPAIQKQIERVLETLDTLTGEDFNVAVFQEIQNLKETTADKEEIVKQIAVLVATPGLDERQGLMAPVVLHLLQLQPQIIIRALAPHLDSDNENVRSFVRDWFQGQDSCGNGASLLQSLNFIDYVDYVQGQLNKNQEIPTAFIEYIYNRSPDRALMVFYYANPVRHAETIAKLREVGENLQVERQQQEGEFEPVNNLEKNREDEIRQRVKEELRKEILLAEHIVSNAIWLKQHDFGERFQMALPEAREQLANLSEREEWWARLYVAEIMRRHRELRHANVFDKLRHDNDELVSKAAKSVKE